MLPYGIYPLSPVAALRFVAVVPFIAGRRCRLFKYGIARHDFVLALQRVYL